MFNLNFKISNFLVCSVLIGAFTGSAFAAEDDLEAYKKGYREAYLDIMRAKEAELSKKQITAKEETKAQDTQTSQSKTNQSQSRTESVTTTGNDRNTPVVVNITLDNSAKQTVSNDSVSTNNNTNNNKNAGLGLAPKAEETDYSYLYGGIGIGSVSGFQHYASYNLSYDGSTWSRYYSNESKKEFGFDGSVIDLGYRFGKNFAINFTDSVSSETEEYQNDNKGKNSIDSFSLLSLSAVLILPLNDRVEFGLEGGYVTALVEHSIGARYTYSPDKTEYHHSVEYTGYMAGLNATYHINDKVSLVAKYRRYELESETASLPQGALPIPVYDDEISSQSLTSLSGSIVYSFR